jgi:DNA-binding response OmpR family regulator
MGGAPVPVDGQEVVLVVDDDPSIREMARSALAQAGFKVGTAQSAAAALEFLRLAPPDVVVLDLAMPDMDGWVFRAAQLAMPGACDVPVVVFSGSLDVEPPSAHLAPAAVVRKPAGMAELVGIVRSVLVRPDG